ncbi:MAG: 3-hydroxyacyl-ACP dehydratase [Betaproteobacteria bacterium]|nr:3-hydroxyacyl-ACP dehydratase [Betaproteobacteria bacterium]
MLHDLSDLLPHRAPMLLLSGLEAFSEAGARATAELREGNPFLLPDGRLERAAYAELMAQCFAAGAGALARRTEEPAAAFGYLAGLRDIVVHGDARLGETLAVSVCIVAALGAVTVLEGEVRRADTLLATGQLKIFIPEKRAAADV